MVAKEFAESPGAAKRKEDEYKKQRQMLDNLVGYISQGRQSKAVEAALEECEKKVEQLGADLEFLGKCHTRLFKTPPKEWIEERVSRIKEVLELKTEIRPAPEEAIWENRHRTGGKGGRVSVPEGEDKASVPGASGERTGAQAPPGFSRRSGRRFDHFQMARPEGFEPPAA